MVTTNKLELRQNIDTKLNRFRLLQQLWAEEFPNWLVCTLNNLPITKSKNKNTAN